MDAKALKEITSELSLLYVEDDNALREETSKLFSHLFKSTQTAQNGEVALKKFKSTSFDLIVTDINMPIMNGVELSRSIRKINPEQALIITSAHDESSYLIELIDIGIDKFILKPLDMNKFLSTLSYVCSKISNEKLVKRYRKEIEASNIKLNQQNTELETLVKILDNKITQMNSTNRLIQKIPQQSPKDAINTISSNPPVAQRSLVKDSTDLFVYNEYMVHNDIEILQKLEVEIDSIITLFKLQENITQEGVVRLSATLNKYASVLDTYALFKSLSKEIHSLSSAIHNNPRAFLQSCGEVCILLESFIYVLKKWHGALFDKGIKDPNIYDQSMINDINTITIFLKGTSDESKENLEFF